MHLIPARRTPPLGQRGAALSTAQPKRALGGFDQFGCPRAEAGNEPQRADSTENEACRKYEMVCMTFAARPVT